MTAPVDRQPDATETSARPEDASSRRAFVRRVGVTVLAGSLAGCGRREPGGTTGEADAGDGGGGGGRAAEAPTVGDAVASPESVLPPLPTAEPVMRVRLRRAGATGPAVIGRGGEWIALAPAAVLPEDARLDRGRFHRARDLPWDRLAALLEGPVRVAREADGAWRVRGARGTPVRTGALDGRALVASRFVDPSVTGDDPTPVRTLHLDGVPHEGVLRLHPRGERGVEVVGLVPMEDYLPGVLEGELYAHWRSAAFEAQAIAARSYAAAERWWWLPRRDHDVEATTRSQVYVGSRVRPRAVEAVRATRGVLVTWRGRVVPAYFSSTCGGIPARARDVISSNPMNAVPPLDGHGRRPCCTNSPRHVWSAEAGLAQVEAGLRAWGEAAGRRAVAHLEGGLAAVAVSERAPNGRPTTYRLTLGRGDRGLTLDAERLQEALNATVLRGRIHASFLRVRVDRSRDRLQVHGHGFGHGAGLCQYGAQAMALEGATGPDIARAYFPDTHLHLTW